ncbi:MAG: hypothetical protein NUV40_01580 [Patescibacteria group bacterium]|nr:hypothetical protein [Patescibacteria group bacterium]
MPIKAFKIWYSDKTFDSAQATAKDIFGAWKEAPDQDIQVVVFYFDENDGLGRPARRYMRGQDFYAMDGEENLSESFDDITKIKGEVKYGKYTTDENISKIEVESLGDYGEGWLWSKPVTHIQGIKTDI